MLRNFSDGEEMGSLDDNFSPCSSRYVKLRHKSASSPGRSSPMRPAPWRRKVSSLVKSAGKN